MMGIVNVTPDSFSGDGALRAGAVSAIALARQMVVDGADLVDVGGESSRPGAAPVPVDEEIGRVVPVVGALAREGIAVSVDTTKPAVMRAALDAGACLINDISALSHPGALEVVAGSGCGVCLMHMQGTPQTMQRAPAYSEVVAEVSAYLRFRYDAALASGVAAGRILVDPGFGFGKSLAHNLALFRALDSIAQIAPVLVGVSRKSMLEGLTGMPLSDRLVPSVTAALAAAVRGAAVLRVHDVRETVAALKVWTALGVGSPPVSPQGC